MSLFNPVTKINRMDVKVESTSVVARLPQYILCASLGLLGGTTGVAVAVGLAIIIQLWLFPSVFAPGMVPMVFAAVLAGLIVSWLLARGGRYIFPALADDSDIYPRQMMLVLSVAISLLQTILYMRM